MTDSKNDLTPTQEYSHRIAAKELPNYLGADSIQYHFRKIELNNTLTLSELKLKLNNLI